MAKEIRKEDLYKKKGIDYKIKYKDNSKRTCPYYLSADSCAVDDFVQSDEIKSIASTLPDQLVPFMDVQLQDETNNMVLDQKREAMLPLEMKAINQDGTDQKLFTFSSFVVGFDNKKEYKNKKLRIVAQDSNTNQRIFYKSFLVDELPNTLEK